MAVSTILALLLTTQATAPTPPPTPAPDQAATAAAGQRIGTTAGAFSACIGPKVPAVPATLTPEQGADSVLAACKAEQSALEGAVEAMIAMAPADKQVEGRQQLRDGMAKARTDIAESIRLARAPAAPATPVTPATPRK